MKKCIKIIMMFIAMTVVLINFNIHTYALSEFVVEDNVLVAYNGNKPKVTIPDGVKMIGESAFANNTALVSISLPLSCTKIGISAFAGCSNLMEINLDHIESIGEKSFEAVAIDTVRFSNQIKEIPLGAFAYATVRVVELGENIESISDSAFINCTNLSEVIVNQKLYVLGSRVFENCTNLKSINLGNTITSIGTKCFTGSGLTKITVPGSCKTIGGNAFNGCANLEEVVIEDGVEFIGGSAFYETSVKKINLPSSITEIEEFGVAGIDTLEEINVDENNQYYSSENGILYSKSYEQLICLPSSYQKLDVIINRNTKFVCERACANLKKVKSVIFQEGLETIYHVAFVNSTSVEKIVLPSSLKQIYSGAFSYASSLYDITLPENLEMLSDSTWIASNGVFQGCSSLVSVTIPKLVKSIGPRTFMDCSLLETVVMECDVADYGSNQFGGNAALESIQINGKNPFAFVDEKGIYYEIKNGESYLSVFPACLRLDEYTVPSNITHIASQAFSCVKYLQELTIPETVTDVGEKVCWSAAIKTVNFFASVSELPTSSFANSSVENVNLGSEIKVIGVYAFSSTSKLKEVVLPEGVTTLAKYCFTESSVEKVIMPNTITNMENPFVMARKLKEVVLSSGLSVIPLASFSYCESLEEVVIPENIIRIEDYAFGYCSSLKKVTLPSTLVEFSSGSFAECKNLENVIISEDNMYLKADFGIVYNSDYSKILFVSSVLPEVVYLKDGVKEVPSFAFTDKVGVKEIHIPSSLETVYYNSFCGLSVEKVVFEEGVEKITYNMFARCANLKEIIFPTTLKLIESGAFSECVSLKQITLPSNVDISEGFSLFSDCTSLVEVNLPSNLKVIPQYLFSGCLSLKYLTIPESVEKIEMYAFKDCKSLSTLVIPQNVAAMEIGIFEGSNIDTVIMLPKTAPNLKTSQFGNNYFELNQKIYIFDDASGYSSNSYKNYNGQMAYVADHILDDKLALNLLDTGQNSIIVSFEKIDHISYQLYQIIDDEEYEISSLSDNSYLINNTIGGTTYQFKLVAVLTNGDQEYLSTSIKSIFIIKSEREYAYEYLLDIMKHGVVDDIDCYLDIIKRYEALDDHSKNSFNELYDIEIIKNRYQELVNLTAIKINIELPKQLKVNDVVDASVTFSDLNLYDYEIISTNQNVIKINDKKQLEAVGQGKVIIQVVSSLGIENVEIEVVDVTSINYDVIFLSIILALLVVVVVVTTIFYKKRKGAYVK